MKNIITLLVFLVTIHTAIAQKVFYNNKKVCELRTLDFTLGYLKYSYSILQTDNKSKKIFAVNYYNPKDFPIVISMPSANNEISLFKSAHELSPDSLLKPKLLYNFIYAVSDRKQSTLINFYIKAFIPEKGKAKLIKIQPKSTFTAKFNIDAKTIKFLEAESTVIYAYCCFIPIMINADAVSSIDTTSEALLNSSAIYIEGTKKIKPIKKRIRKAPINALLYLGGKALEDNEVKLNKK